MYVFCSSTPWYVEGGAQQSRYLSSRSYILMTGNFLLSLSDNCCFYERLNPGRSKKYVTFDIAEESCTWSLTASNVYEFWHFQSLVWSKFIALILTHIIMSTVTYWEESRTWLVNHHIRTIHSLLYSVICFHLHMCRPDQLATGNIIIWKPTIYQRYHTIHVKQSLRHTFEYSWDGGVKGMFLPSLCRPCLF